MPKVIIVYASTYGNTEKMAQAVMTGVKSVEGTSCDLKKAEEVTKEDLLASDAIIVGSPVHMGSPDWRVKRFIDDICSGLWMKNKLNGKVAGVFCTGSGFGTAGGGCELTMLAMLNNFAELGMIMVPLPKNTPGYQYGGLQWGPYARSASLTMEQIGIQDNMLEVAHHHGANIARVTKLLAGKTFYAT